MCETYTIHGRDEKFIQNLVGVPEAKNPLERKILK
jgi:hypothetical protein